MRLWAALTCLLYLVTMILVTAPVLWLAGLNRNSAGVWEYLVSWDDIANAYQHWAYWIWLAVVLGSQAVLLLIPVDVAQRRPTSRRRLLWPVVTAGFLFACVFSGLVISLLCAIFGDEGLEYFVEAVRPMAGSGNSIPARAIGRLGLTPGSDFDFLLGLGSILIALWLVWGTVFYRFALAGDPEALSRRIVRWLLGGSILELLVAVPSHVIVRGRDECCAPLGTFWGIATGLSVMLLAFGPGVFFLFVERFRRLRPANPSGQGTVG